MSEAEARIVDLLRGTLSAQHVAEATSALRAALKRPSTLLVLLKLLAEHPDDAVRRHTSACAILHAHTLAHFAPLALRTHTQSRACPLALN